ncbi:MAG TPA: hypothetical protein EYQ47_04460 [Cycloclasticus sp.]|jgi:hypothetical protein|nr:hypothetical protein [Cycloclasticus sp.]
MTQLLLVISLIVTTAVVLVVVGYLIAIIIALYGAIQNLSKLAGGLVAIKENTAPLGEHVETINGGLSVLLTGLLSVNGNLAAIVKVATSRD